MKTSEWIPDDNGKFFKPGDIDVKKISEKFLKNNPYSENNKMIEALNFGENQGHKKLKALAV